MSESLARTEIEKLLNEAGAGRLGLSREGVPYVVPLCYVYNGDRIYLHSSGSGRKIDYLRANPRACFQVDRVGELLKSDQPCQFNLAYLSVLAEGEIAEVVDEAEKLAGLKLLTAKYGGAVAADRLKPADLRSVTVLKITLDRLSGRANLVD